MSNLTLRSSDTLARLNFLPTIFHASDWRDCLRVYSSLINILARLRSVAIPFHSNKAMLEQRKYLNIDVDK